MRARKGPWEAPARGSFSTKRSKAKWRKIPWEITLDEYIRLSALPCYLCGVTEQSIYTYRSHGKQMGEFKYNGLDRVDSNKGYTMDNVQTCCWTCNSMKNDSTLKGFKKHLKRILRYITK